MYAKRLRKKQLSPINPLHVIPRSIRIATFEFLKIPKITDTSFAAIKIKIIKKIGRNLVVEKGKLVVFVTCRKFTILWIFIPRDAFVTTSPINRERRGEGRKADRRNRQTWKKEKKENEFPANTRQHSMLANEALINPFYRAEQSVSFFSEE